MSRLILCIALCLATLAGCSTPNYVDPNRVRVDFNAPSQLASGDRLRVIVFGQDQLTNSYSIDGAGNFSMPLIGLVHAQALTTTQVAGEIEGRLRQGYLRDPKVSVEVEAYRPFYVLGEVGVPGQYPYVNGMTVQNAVAIAGGFAPRGAQDSVDLTRIISGHPYTVDAPLTFAVRPGDTINVRERFF